MIQNIKNSISYTQLSQTPLHKHSTNITFSSRRYHLIKTLEIYGSAAHIWYAEAVNFSSFTRCHKLWSGTSGLLDCFGDGSTMAARR